MSVLIVYSTVDGHTLKICRHIAHRLSGVGQAVKLVDVAEFETAQINANTQIVIGASIRYGRHAKAVYSMIAANKAQLEQAGAAFFSVNLVARKPEKRAPDSNPYTRRFLQQLAWRPALAAVFAGRLNYPAYGFWDRLMIRLIMRITKGPTDPQTDIEYTDWQQVDGFCDDLLVLIASRSTTL